MRGDFVDPQEQVTLTGRSGRQVLVRRVAPEDAERLVELYYSLSAETQELRFFASNRPVAVIQKHVSGVVHADPRLNLVLVAFVSEGERQRAIGVARYACEAAEPAIAEFAIVVQDDYQADGLGRQLLNLLVEAARLRGVTHLRATWRSQNQAIQKMIVNSGLPFTSTTSQGETTTLLELGPPGGI